MHNCSQNEKLLRWQLAKIILIWAFEVNIKIQSFNDKRFVLTILSSLFEMSQISIF